MTSHPHSTGARNRMIVETLTLTRRLAGHVDRPGGAPSNLDRLLGAQPGLRGTRYDSDPGHGSQISDPTGTAAGRPDQPAHDLHNVDRDLATVMRALDRIDRTLANYDPPRAANEADRLALARANTRPDPHCEHCATIQEPHGDTPWLVPPDHRRKGPTSVAGRLDPPMTLCAWCADFVGRQNTLPSTDQLEARRDGRRVLVADKTPRRTA